MGRKDRSNRIECGFRALIKRPAAWISAALYLGAAIVIGWMFASCADGGIWMDEAFSFGLTDRGFFGLIPLTAKDVHPPLYYMILKACDALASLLSPNRFAAARAVSVLPYLVLVAECLLVVRKDFGLLASGLFAFTIVTAPNVFLFASEIRMYSWALLFSTAALFRVYAVMRSPSRLPPWFLLAFDSLCAAYTHYFALLTVLLLWLALFIVFSVRDRKALPRFFLFAGGTVLLYAPWLYCLAVQIHAYSGISASFVDWSRMGSTLRFTFGSGWLGICLPIAVLLLAAARLRFRFDSEACFALIGFAVYAAVLLVLVLYAGLTVHPVFEKYCFPAVSCVWYPACILAARAFEQRPSDCAKASRPRLRLALLRACASLCCIGLLFGGAVATADGWKSYCAERDAYRIYRAEVLDRIGAGDAVVCDNQLFGASVLTISLPQADCYAYPEPSELVWVIRKIGCVRSERAVLALAKRRTVWFFATQEETAESLQLACAAEGIACRYIGFYPQVDTQGLAASQVYRLGEEE